MRHPGTLAICISKEGREAETEKEGMRITTNLGHLAFGVHSQEVKCPKAEGHDSLKVESLRVPISQAENNVRNPDDGDYHSLTASLLPGSRVHRKKAWCSSNT